MFTGVIQEIGFVGSIKHRNQTAILQLTVNELISELQLGSSIAINGVCLTVRDQNHNSISTDLSMETLNRSVLGRLQPGDPVNLELPLLPTTRLGGHFVQGHVDATTKVYSIQKSQDFAIFQFILPDLVKPYVVEKGSIAVDGISLTVSRLQKDFFEVSIIPHTLENTNLGYRLRGHHVNLECDMLAKYVEKCLGLDQRKSNKSTMIVPDLID